MGITESERSIEDTALGNAGLIAMRVRKHWQHGRTRFTNWERNMSRERAKVLNDQGMSHQANLVSQRGTGRSMDPKYAKAKKRR